MYTILVAENEPWVLKGIVEMIKAAGEEFEIVGACSNGEEAWNMIHEVWPMLLITDIMMPETDGLSLIEKIKEHRLPLVPLIISGYDNFQYAQKAMSWGVSEYLLKPVEFASFVNALNRSKEKLETLRDLNQYVVRFQNLLENKQGLSPQAVLQKQSDLLKSILQLNLFNKNARVSLLQIIDNKLKSSLHDFGIDFSDKSFHHSDSDSSIIAYFNHLLEKWYLEYPIAISASKPEPIERSCRYIMEHYKRDITLMEMAELTNFSISHFSVLFKKHTGSSLISYVNDLRIEEAKKLLLKSSFSVSEIGETVGFSTTPYFTRVFKAAAGVSPLKYRKKLSP
jgi:two-component system response regulator YesN